MQSAGGVSAARGASCVLMDDGRVFGSTTSKNALVRGATIAAIVAGLTSTAMAQAPPLSALPERLTIGYVDVTGDPRYEPITGYGRRVLKQREHPFVAAQVGLDEAQALSR